MFKEEEVIRSEVTGMDTNIARRLLFLSMTSRSGWMDDSLLFDTLEELVIFLDRVELLFRIARAQQRGD